MNVIKYWSRKGMAALYLAAAAVIAAFFAAVGTGGIPLFGRMLPIIYVLLLLFRNADDWFDFKKDTGNKPQPLTKKQLGIMFCILSIICTFLHLLLFGRIGLWGIATIAAILIAETVPLLKPAYLPGSFLLYFWLSGIECGRSQIVVCVGCLLVSAVYAGFKRKKS